MEIKKKNQLTPHFTLEELTKSNALEAYNKANHRSILNGPPLDEEVLNLTRLAKVLEFIRDGERMIINSGYRSPFVNQIVGGAKRSRHKLGCAADINCTSFDDAVRKAAKAKKAALSCIDIVEIIISNKADVWWLHLGITDIREARLRVPKIKLDLTGFKPAGVFL